MPTRLSILDLAPIGPGQSASDSFAGSVALAQQAEELGYERVWYAEHHNMPSIASSATSVLIAHIGAHTQRIRLGAGGVMLPNHAPLVIAERFKMLEALFPGRIDLGRLHVDDIDGILLLLDCRFGRPTRTDRNGLKVFCVTWLNRHQQERRRTQQTYRNSGT